MQSHLISPSSFHSQPPLMSYNNSLMYPSPGLNNINPSVRAPPPNEPQPYNSSLAFMQGNRRNLPPLQATDRCFSSSNNKTKPQLSSSSLQTTRSYSFSSSSSNNGIMPLLSNAPPPLLSAPPLMKINPTLSFTSSTPNALEPISPRWSNTTDPQQRGFHPFWCATCALGFPHQVAYQDHLRSHIPVRYSIIFYR